MISCSTPASLASVFNSSRCRLMLRHTPAQTPIRNLALIQSSGTVVSWWMSEENKGPVNYRRKD